jgi:chlorobactene glucosyltransferase
LFAGRQKNSGQASGKANAACAHTFAAPPAIDSQGRAASPKVEHLGLLRDWSPARTFRKLHDRGLTPRIEPVYLILSFFWLVVVAYLLVRALRQRRALTSLRSGSFRDAPPVTVVIPARNEGCNIGTCLKSLVRQRYGGRLGIVVVDDDSADDTNGQVRAVASIDKRISLIRAPVLPPDWVGKVNACHAGAAAVPADVEWLCFMDADMWADARLLASAVSAAVREKLDLLSLAPRQELGSFAERLILPCGLYLLGFCQDLDHVQSKDSGDAIATGQFMLIRREAYGAVGGHGAVSGAICEDVELARLFKRRGYSVIMKDGSAFLSTRMYTGWSTLWPGIAKNLSDMLGGPSKTILTAAIALVLAWATFVIPALDIAACAASSHDACLAAGPALLGSMAAIALHVAGAAHFGIPICYGLLFPVGYGAGVLLALDSVRSKWLGRIRWKGRTYK